MRDQPDHRVPAERRALRRRSRAADRRCARPRSPSARPRASGRAPGHGSRPARRGTLRRPGRAAPTEQATHHGVAPEALPEPLESVEAAQRSRLQELEGLGGEERRPGIGLRREEARKRALERHRLSESTRPKL